MDRVDKGASDVTRGEHQAFAEVDAGAGPIFLWDPHDIDGERSEGFIEVLPMRRKHWRDASTYEGYANRTTKVGALSHTFLLLSLHTNGLYPYLRFFDLG
jgi:hypothetical protein